MQAMSQDIAHLKQPLTLVLINFACLHELFEALKASCELRLFVQRAIPVLMTRFQEICGAHFDFPRLTDRARGQMETLERSLGLVRGESYGFYPWWRACSCVPGKIFSAVSHRGNLPTACNCRPT